MKAQKNEWYYIDEETGQQVGPVTFDELEAARRAGRIEEYSQVINA